jgi:addiction module RelE/StbE family toxin
MAPKWTRTALRTLDDIFHFVAADNPARAQSFAQELRTKVERLGEFPELGRPGRVNGTRELVLHPNYLAIYRVRQGQVEILRIHHAAMRQR